MMVSIRFDKPSVVTSNPVVIRFVDDGGTPQPQPLAQIIGDCGFSWAHDGDVVGDVTVVMDSGEVSRSDTVFVDEANSTHVVISLPWEIGDIITIHLDAKVVLPDELMSLTDLSWGSGTIINTQVDASWLGSEITNVDTLVVTRMTDTITTTVDMVFTDVVMNIGDIAIQYSQQGANAATSCCDFAYGIRVGQWVCTTTYRPSVKGASISFSDALNGSRVLRFKQHTEWCEYDNGGGGVIDPNPTLPDIDVDIPIEPELKRVYSMKPVLKCVRMSDQLQIAIVSVSISDSRGQHTKTVSIEFASRIDQLNSMNEQLLININGYEFYAIAEKGSRTTSFGSSRYGATGRSRTALMSDPWSARISYSNTRDRSFAGIVGDIAEGSGWTVSLHPDVVDYNVPEGAFSISGKTVIGSIHDAAAQIGCMLLCDEFASTVTIVPQFPTAPWRMATATPDVTLSDTFIFSCDEVDEHNQLSDSVFVRGEQHGVSCQIKRAGTAGAKIAGDVSAQLITHAQAARLAGTKVLAESGNKKRVTLSLPVSGQVAPLTKGSLVGVTYRGDVYKATLDSVTITASVMQSGGITAGQTVTLIRHME